MEHSDSLTKSFPSGNFLALLTQNKFKIATGEIKGEIRRKLPPCKHYIVYPEKVQRGKELRKFMRRKTLVWRGVFFGSCCHVLN